MPRLIDREEFDEVVDAISRIKVMQADYKRDLQLLSSNVPDSRISYRFADFLRKDKSINREAAKQYFQERIKELGERKEQVICYMENELSDKNGNIRRFFDGEPGLTMTNPTTGKVYLIMPPSKRTTLYVVLIVERQVNEKLPICRSDYKEIEKYLRKERCSFPKELFII